MIEVRIPIPIHEYFKVRDDLEEQFNKHSIPIWMSADTVIRTWAGLTYFGWFHEQDGIDVDQHVGWGEIEGEWQPQAMNAAVSHNFVDEDMRPFVVMMFHDDEADYDDDGYSKSQKDLATLFKLTFGGRRPQYAMEGDLKMPMRTPNFRQAMMPYGMNKNPDGSWTFFNRHYKTLGTITDDWSEWDDPKHKLKLKGLGSATLKKLDHDNEDTGDRIYFYDDGCNPENSAADMKAYLERLKILMRCQASLD